MFVSVVTTFMITSASHSPFRRRRVMRAERRGSRVQRSASVCCRDRLRHPLAPLAELPGVAQAGEEAREALGKAHRHRANLRGWPATAAEAALRAARASSVLDGGALQLPEAGRARSRCSPARFGCRRRWRVVRRSLVGVWQKSPDAGVGAAARAGRRRPRRRRPARPPARGRGRRPSARAVGRISSPATESEQCPRRCSPPSSTASC